jgi:hypothetical protein
MAIEIPNTVVAEGAITSTGTETWANGATVVSGGAGLYNCTVEAGGVDATECGVLATIRGTTAGFITCEQSTDTLKIFHTFNTSGTSTNLAFDFLIYQKPAG